MATRKKRRDRNRASSGAPRASNALQFSQVNAFLGLGGLVCLVLGYWLLAQGSITLAPLVLVLGYVVLIPLAILI